MSTRLAIYFHLPFCRRKCSYCSFISYGGREADIPRYLSALRNELKRRAGGEAVVSVYFGGGTPSLLTAPDIKEILSATGTLYRLEGDAEISLEANPDSAGIDWMRALRAGGVNRLSLGIQSLNDAELKLLGRLHSAADARKAALAARQAGFNNLNIDLIYGLPGQSSRDFKKTLTEVIDMAPEHISLYALSLEQDVPLWLTMQRGQLPAIDPDKSAAHYEMASDILAAAGYDHYEISNWARAGCRCRHNLTYWRNQPYLGFGAAAHSWTDGRRFANTADIDTYVGALSRGELPPRDPDEEIDDKLELAETIILGLRLSDGVGAGDIGERFGIDLMTEYAAVIGELGDLGLLEHAGERLRLTPRGRLLGNEVFWRFLPD